MQLIIVTGLSGSGKSIALRALEDYGFYCIDNLPATLLPQISSHLDGHNQERVAISIDSRSSALNALPHAISELEAGGINVEVLFLESNVETLVKRFSETRRKHPLSDGTITLAESIAHERDLLADLAELTTNLGHHIDTSNLSANALRKYIKEFIALKYNQENSQTNDQQDMQASNPHKHGLVLLLTSFGFKHGIPLDADFVFDVRCLPNPHYDPMLRPLTGQDFPIKQFLSAEPDVLKMLGDIRTFVENWLPCFEQDNRSYLTVAIGCTGGQHRSVYFVEELATYFKQHLNEKEHRVLVRHRELQHLANE